MQDVQELMNKMESLNEEITNIINKTKQGNIDDETEKSLVGIVPSKTGKCGSRDNCPYFTRKVKLCCTAVVKHFNVLNINGDIDPATVKLIFDPSCLHAMVDTDTVKICHENCGEICVYVVKVVGCIPFAFSATGAIKGIKAHYGVPGTTCPKTATADLCCQGCICVDNNICCYTDKGKAEIARGVIASGLNCENISITSAASAELLTCKNCYWGRPRVDGCKDETYVKFTAELEVPNIVTTPCPEQIAPICGTPV